MHLVTITSHVVSKPDIPNIATWPLPPQGHLMVKRTWDEPTGNINNMSFSSPSLLSVPSLPACHKHSQTRACTNTTYSILQVQILQVQFASYYPYLKYQAIRAPTFATTDVSCAHLCSRPANDKPSLFSPIYIFPYRPVL